MEVNNLMGTQLILDKIHSTNRVQDVYGKEYVLNSNIDKEEGKFLENLILENGFKNSIEIGCAYGISSLYICGALQNSNSLHTIIDPFQAIEWNNIGVDQLRKAGVINFRLIEKCSEISL